MPRKLKVLVLVAALAVILGIVGGTVYAAGNESCDDVPNCCSAEYGSRNCH